MATQENKRSNGPLIGIIAIVVLLVLGAWYLWSGNKLSPSGTMIPQAATVAPVSPSDDIGSIESDLKATDPGPDLSGLGK